MDNYIGKRWYELDEELKVELLNGLSITNNKEGNCVIDFNNGLAIKGELTDNFYHTELDLLIGSDDVVYVTKDGILDLENIEENDLVAIGKMLSDDRRLLIDDNAILYDINSELHIKNDKFIGLIGLSDAAKKYKKNDSTLRKNIRNGLFKEGEDCIKLGNQWVFDENSLDRVYK